MNFTVSIFFLILHIEQTPFEVLSKSMSGFPHLEKFSLNKIVQVILFVIHVSLFHP